MSRIFMLAAVLLPLAGALLIVLIRPRSAKVRQRIVMISVCAASLLVLAMLIHRPTGTLNLLRLTRDLSISLRLDGLASVFAGLVAFLWPLASLYALEYIKHEDGHNRFFTYYTGTYGVTLGIAMSANLMTFYLFYEMLTLITLPLVMHTGDVRSIKAGKKYLTYSIGGAAMAFVGMMVLYVLGNTTLRFEYGGFLSPEDPRAGLLRGAYLLCFFGFGVKAAIFPFHGWLPAAGVAPTPVTALLHAVAVVKAGVFAIMRITFYCFGPALLAGTWAQTVVMAFAIFTIVFGSATALREQHLKRRLAYSTVSNLSYIVFGVTLMTPAGLAAGLSHMLFHGVMKITLFFCAGAVMYRTHREWVPELDGLGRKMPVTFAAFTVGSMALVGVPLLPGFLSKFGLATAAMAAGGIEPLLGVIALLISAVLTAAYLFIPVCNAFFPARDSVPPKGRHISDPNLYMTVPFVILILSMLALGVGSASLVDVLGRIAAGTF